MKAIKLLGSLLALLFTGIIILGNPATTKADDTHTPVNPIILPGGVIFQDQQSIGYTIARMSGARIDKLTPGIVLSLPSDAGSSVKWKITSDNNLQWRSVYSSFAPAPTAGVGYSLVNYNLNGSFIITGITEGELEPGSSVRIPAYVRWGTRRGYYNGSYTLQTFHNNEWKFGRTVWLKLYVN